MTTRLTIIKTIAVFVLLLIFTGCSAVQDGTTADDNNLHTGKISTDANTNTLEGEYVNTQITVDDVPMELVEGTSVFIRFKEDGTISAQAGCNHIIGEFTVEDGVLVSDSLGMSEMGCSMELHTQDDWVVQVLTSNPTIAKAGNKLTLVTTLDDGQVVVVELIDEAAVYPDLPLNGILWTVDTLISGESASNSDWENPATLTFNADGTLEIFAGCNSASATFETEKNIISISNLSVTDMACTDSMDLEYAVLDVLSNESLTFEIKKNRLTLSAANTGLSLTGENE